MHMKLALSKNAKLRCAEAGESPFRKHKLAIQVCYIDSPSTRFLVTYSTWFLENTTPDAHHFSFEGATPNLHRLHLSVGTALGEWLAQCDQTDHPLVPNFLPPTWTSVPEWALLRPNYTWLAFGSHAEELSYTGVNVSVTAALDKIKDALHDDSRSFLFPAVPPVREQFIAEHFPAQELVRNDPRIEAYNFQLEQLLNEKKAIGPKCVGHARGVYFDTFTMLRGVGTEVGRLNDGVHFVDAVYQAWVSILWTDMKSH